MKKVGFNEALNQIQAEDPRFRPQAYHFIREALDFSIKHFSKPLEGPGKHVSGTELLEGIRRFALQEYGPMAMTVLSHWGVTTTDDFGHLVFNLVNKGVLGKTDEDRLEDFLDGYDFDEVFRKPFRPRVADPARLAPSPDKAE